MTSGSYRFGDFTLDPADRQLRREGRPVELNARYLDALTLMVRDAGSLVTKDRFMTEVWQGIPVTDEALTQCVRTLRRLLGDDAARPRFIETVPKHGYRFIAPVQAAAAGEGRAAPVVDSTPAPVAGRLPWASIGRLTAAGTAGGAVAGIVGGLIYGFAGTAPGVGAVSVLLVLLSLTLVLAVVGAASVSFGIAAARNAGGPTWLWSVAGGAAGGLVTGALVKLVGSDAFTLLFGRAPGDVTGAPEGAMLGAAVGLACWLAVRRRRPGLRRGLILGGIAGIASGLLIALLDGRLLGGSLTLLARLFPDSRLRFDQIGALFGEPQFGPIAEAVTCAAEAGLFVACVTGALALTTRKVKDA